MVEPRNVSLCVNVRLRGNSAASLLSQILHLTLAAGSVSEESVGFSLRGKMCAPEELSK